MIQIVPAIDLIGGRCVRLTRGEYSSKKEYGASPLDAAMAFADCGVRRVHMVDLDGAKAGHPVNLGVLEEVSSNVSCEIEWGGGISDAAALESVFSAGASHAIIGSLALRNPSLFQSWLSDYGARMVLGADVRNGLVSVAGWTRQTAVGVVDLIAGFPALREVVCTDIDRDGTLQGPSVELYSSLQGRFPSLCITASGGVSSMDDIRTLDGMGLDRAIVGKAFYEGKITLEDMAEWSQRG